MRLIPILCLVFLTAVGRAVDLLSIPGAEFATPVAAEKIDRAAFAEWFDGSEHAITGSDEGRQPGWVLSTTTTTTGHSGLLFGDSKIPGPRHLRIGFTEALPVGTVFAEGALQVSVLKPGAAYPGNLNDDNAWLPAQRLDEGKIGVTETTAKKDLALWVLPPGTRTRALRFTHVAMPADDSYAGRLDGALVLTQRLTNEASSAVAGASINRQAATGLNNGSHDSWAAWENEEKDTPAEKSRGVSREHPEWVTLTWPQPVKLDGLIAFWAGIGESEVQRYIGPADRDPRDGTDADWETVATYTGILHQYATRFWPNRLAFPQPVETRAIRLRILAPGQARSHATNNDGRRIWLGELLAIRSLGDEPLSAPPTVAQEIHPPVPVRFHLDRPGYVSLVIERPDGFRIRNLVSETWFPAGDNIAWWDGADDLGRDAEAAQHGVYHVPPHPVDPGGYRVRGIVRGEIEPHYEFSVYAPGDPPWTTDDSTGGWLANHSPPQAAVFVPAAQSPTGQPVVYLGCYVTEGPSGLAWVDLDGKKLGGKRWVGGNWTAAPYLARDTGPAFDPATHVYVASSWESEQSKDMGEIRLTALTKDGDKALMKIPAGPLAPQGKGERAAALLGGLAVWNQTIVLSLTQEGQLLVVDPHGAKQPKRIAVPEPRGVAFERDGALLAISGRKLLRFPSLQENPVALISSGLEQPVGITVDEEGLIYIGDQGSNQQVKVYDPKGRLLRTIGKPGPSHAGPYDPLHLNQPMGLAVDSRHQLWVAEHDFMPKRVSVWSAKGEFVQAFYGPGKYGGGGALDPHDKTKFYYADEDRGTLEFHLDWGKGTSRLERVLYRRDEKNLVLPANAAAPESAIYYENRRYFTNAWNSNPTGGSRGVFVFREAEGVCRAAAGAGNAADWEVLKDAVFRSRWPAGIDPQGKAAVFYVWSDLNGDGHAQPEEVTLVKGESGGVTVLPDLSFCIARLEGKALRLRPVRFTQAGVPVYDLAQAEVLAGGVENPRSSGGDQALAADDGWSLVTLGVAPFDGLSVSGAKDGVAKWSYPNLWPGLHASHEAPRPDRQGELIGATRLPGGFFEVAGSDAGPLWALHTNHGRMAVFTRDGIFVASLFEDMRGGSGWKMPSATRDMSLKGVTLGEENFWPTLTHSEGGKVYLVDGARSAIVRLDGMDSIRRLRDSDLAFTEEDLERCRTWQMEAEQARQKSGGSHAMQVTLREAKPVVDGKLDDWAGAQWVDIDKSGVKAYFNSNAKPYDITGALAVAGDRLYAGWRTGDRPVLKNSGEMPLAPFKTGDALDLMLGPSGDRKAPVAGDLRLLVTMVKDKPRALLYRAVVPGTKAEDKVPFSSPSRTITFDQVEDVTAQIEFAGSGSDYEVSIPLKLLGIDPKKGDTLRGDIGMLRGDGGETRARTYWSNKATGIVSDVPDEAMLTPGLWGVLEFR